MKTKLTLCLSLLTFSFLGAWGSKNEKKDGMDSDVGKYAGIGVWNKFEEGLGVALEKFMDKGSTYIPIVVGIGAVYVGVVAVSTVVDLLKDDAEEKKLNALKLKHMELKESELNAKQSFVNCLETTSKSQTPVEMNFGLPITCEGYAKMYEAYVGPKGINEFRKNQPEREKYSAEKINAEIELGKCRSKYPEPRTYASFDKCKSEKAYMKFIEDKLYEVNNRQS